MIDRMKYPTRLRDIVDVVAYVGGFTVFSRALAASALTAMLRDALAPR